LNWPPLTDYFTAPFQAAGIDSLADLARLRRVNLYNSQVSTYTVVRIAESCKSLEHLNLGQCIAVQNWDATLLLVVSKAPQLKSLNLWRARTLSHVGIAHIAAHCPGLESLDIGWCRSVNAPECIPLLVRACGHLRKLSMTALRTTNDTCIEALAQHCPQLEQLDILGSNAITPPAMHAALETCRKLLYLDVSFCRHVETHDVDQLRQGFPAVSIKNSLQTNV